MSSNRATLDALKLVLSEADRIMTGTQFPENRDSHCRKLLKAALSLADELISQNPTKPSVQISRDSRCIPE
jgi:hypothetical protein